MRKEQEYIFLPYSRGPAAQTLPPPKIRRSPGQEAEDREPITDRRVPSERFERDDRQSRASHASLTRAVFVGNSAGLHLRTCMALVAAVRQHQAQVTIEKDGQAENAASMLGLLSLAATQGTRLLLSATGPEAHLALEAVAQVLAGDESPRDHSLPQRAWA
jgi:phosphocarrier protein HPr